MAMKNLKISLLLDFYGAILTDKQRESLELYYNEDLSLAEISEILNVTRQGVRDSIKRGEGQLLELEKKLMLARKFKVIEARLGDVKELVSGENSDKVISILDEIIDEI